MRRKLGRENGGVRMIRVRFTKRETCRVRMSPVMWKKGRTARPFSEVPWGLLDWICRH